jgi:trans-2-enoyl-CoA reductase
MKNIIWVSLIFLVLGCKSSEKTLNTSFEENQQQIESLEEKKGISASFNASQLFSNQLKVTRFEPIYLNVGGKDTVILKEVIYEQTSIAQTEEKSSTVDTTALTSKSESNSKVLETKDLNREFKGYNIIQSIIGGITTIIIGPFKWILWIVALLLIIPIFRFIKNKLTKK